jgi:hypothetical protein
MKVRARRGLSAGKELARQFAAKGARLILSSRRREALLAVRTEIVAASRGAVQDEDIKVVTLDLEHVDSMRDCARAAVASFGKVRPNLSPESRGPLMHLHTPSRARKFSWVCTLSVPHDSNRREPFEMHIR